MQETKYLIFHLGRYDLRREMVDEEVVTLHRLWEGLSLERPEYVSNGETLLIIRITS